ncbi:hypothetical protein [Stenotrophomonas sp. 24(2023)]|uniref:hypothetical protein n=1 Tax=Stenotrophomonas sp. 24(2023) TaxID=3068324 RepID=UPI0027DFB839|nr:hypothetical protein [Stenotrophomonas sp. 24(2023)]WMJ68712.1 hypothetical protein Q9R17_16200 [Stenotrophomonas sp. 24(2023)]
MSHGAPPPPPAHPDRPTPSPPPPTLTGAAWNHRHAQRPLPGLAHWPGWLRSMPEGTRGQGLIHLFGALFFALPGSLLAFSGSGHAPPPLSLAVLLFVAVHALLHGLCALQHTRPTPPRPLLAALERHLPWLLVASLALPLAAYAGGHGAAGLLVVGCTTTLLIPGSAWRGQPRYPPARRGLQAAAAAVVLVCTTLLCLPLPLQPLAWVWAGGLAYVLGLALQLHPLHRAGRLLWSCLMVLGSLLHFIAVALITIPAGP